MDDRERYEAAATAMWANLGKLADAMLASVPGDWYFLRRTAAQREAEERDRQEWLDGIKQRLGLVTADEIMRLSADFQSDLAAAYDHALGLDRPRDPAKPFEGMLAALGAETGDEE